MNKEDLRLRSWYGEGYYSGASKLEVLVYDVNDIELLENNCKVFTQKERYMGELDGKHSEVTGDVCDEDETDFLFIIDTYKDADTDVFEDEYYHEEDSDVYRALKKASEFVNKFTIKQVYRHKGTGEILDLSMYELREEVVEK